MPIEWALIFLGTIIACVYFSYNSGMKHGVETATILTLSHLEDKGLIHFDNNGNIKSGKGTTKSNIMEKLLNEQDGE